jgi:outer membrane lipoprotein carrier protein
MRKAKAGIFLLLLVSALCAPALWGQSTPSGTNARAVAARIDARYNGMKSLYADFTEIYSGGGIRRSESGTLWMKKPGKMRWDYSTPEKKIFVTDGSTAWFYVPGERQARRTAVKKLDDLRSPLRYLLGRTKLEKELRGLSLAPDVQPENAGDVMLRGVPIGMEDRVSQVLLESDGQGFLRRIVMDELDGSRTEFRLDGQRENAAVDDAEFRFRPPAGVEVLQSEQLAP